MVREEWKTVNNKMVLLSRERATLAVCRTGKAQYGEDVCREPPRSREVIFTGRSSSKSFSKKLP